MITSAHEGLHDVTDGIVQSAVNDGSGLSCVTIDAHKRLRGNVSNGRPQKEEVDKAHHRLDLSEGIRPPPRSRSVVFEKHNVQNSKRPRTLRDHE